VISDNTDLDNRTLWSKTLWFLVTSLPGWLWRVCKLKLIW
jgi:hypothetical protein